jgi:NhaP-type Na+/H+ and K+/H+ antiporter
MQDYLVPETSNACDKRIVELNIPAKINLLAIKRSGVYIAPNGSTKLLANDILYILAEDRLSIEDLVIRLELQEVPGKAELPREITGPDKTH